MAFYATMKLKTLAELSKSRWTYPEKEGITTGHMGYGDVSGWSTGTTRAIRPEVGRLKVVSCPITSIRALREAADRVVAQKAHDSTEIVGPETSGKREVEAAIKDCEKNIKIAAQRIAAPKRIQKTLVSLSKVGGTVREFVDSADDRMAKLRELNAMRKAGINQEYVKPRSI